MRESGTQADLRPTMFTLTTTSRAATVQLGTRLGALLIPGDIICLAGDLGAGKTAFTYGIGLGWGAHESVHSPTFVFSHEHRRTIDSVRLYHVDCYRMRGPEDAESVGLSDILSGDHVVVIEWPERIVPILPDAQFWVTLNALSSDQDPEGFTRHLHFEATGARPNALLEQFFRSVEQPT